MDPSANRNNSHQRLLEGTTAKKMKRLQHIKSLPAYDQGSMRKSSFSKIIEVRSKDQQEIKMKRYKIQQHLKTPYFIAVKTSRDRNFVMAQRKQQPSLASKSMTKSTTYRSPQEENEKRRGRKGSKSKSKKSLKRIYSNLLKRAEEVMQAYQLKLSRELQQKQEMLRVNIRLKSQLEFVGKRGKKIDRPN